MKKIFTAVLVVAVSACGATTDSTDSTSASDTTSVTSTTKVKPFEITLTVGENTGPDVVIDVEQDSEVVLTFVNPGSHDEIHLHGYDLSTGTVDKGDEAVLTFRANEAGDFEIESHETGDLLATLRVSAA